MSNVIVCYFVAINLQLNEHVVHVHKEITLRMQRGGCMEGFIPVAQDWHVGLCFLQERISVLKSYMHDF